MNPNTPWLAANPDGWAERDGRRLLVVVKSIPWREESWPAPWLVATVQHELAATGATAALVGVLEAGAAFHTQTMAADPAYQAELLQAEGAFVERLLAGRPPEAGPHDLGALEAVSDDDGKVRALGPRAALAWGAIQAARRKADANRQAARSLEAKVAQLISGHSAGRLPDGRVLALRGSAGRRRLVELPPRV